MIRDVGMYRIASAFFTMMMVWIGWFGTAYADPLIETREIIYSGEGETLAQKADELQTPAAIYEYVRNTHEYALYHGSRSNSINTFSGLRGNDVDIASVLIAMYRSQSIPARYAVGDIIVPDVDVMNWLGVKNSDLAADVMTYQGIQNVMQIDNAGQQFIQFEHVWVQVQVPYDEYRGAVASTIDCTMTPERCHWVDVDSSYKLREYHNQDIDIYDQVNFNYTRFYNALKDNDLDYRDKNPLEIYEEEILAWLPGNGYSGKSLEDVADPGEIIRVDAGILPASLPYQVVNLIATYDSVEDHDNDTITVKTWAKFVDIVIEALDHNTSGELVGSATIPLGQFALADVSTKPLTLRYDPLDPSGLVFAAYLDGQIGDEKIIIGNVYDGILIEEGNFFNLHIHVDGAPATEPEGEDQDIDANYTNLLFDHRGHFLIGTGGYTSNWSQVHRAANELLEANVQYPIIYDSGETDCDVETGIGCTPYVDVNNDGTLDAGEPELEADSVADTALTEGLLYVAMNHYFARFADSLRRLDALNHVISPINGLVGVTSSTFDVDYLNHTAFSIMPGGLLIDMKGQELSGMFRNDLSDSSASKHFKLFGHMMSALEHEVWQELTGFDAISTVRGIQMGLANDLSLAVFNESTLDTVYDSLVDFSTSPLMNSSNYNTYDFDSGFVGLYYPELGISFEGYWTTLSESVPDASMEVFKKSINPSTTSLRRSIAEYPFSISANFTNVIDCYFINFANLLHAYGTGNETVTDWNSDMHHKYPHYPSDICFGTFAGTFPTFSIGVLGDGMSSSLYEAFAESLYSFVNENIEFIDFFSLEPGQYKESQHAFRKLVDVSPVAYSADLVTTFRDNVSLHPDDVEVTMPGGFVDTVNNKFLVYIEEYSVSGNIYKQNFIIQNSDINAGGGYVDGDVPLQAATAIPSVTAILPTFENEVFTDQNLVGVTNNDLIRTPSTADPISTVTGNMYHDETDLMIKGRGLDYVFTRSYNSGPARANQPGPLGYGWTHSYNMSLRSNDYGKCPNCTSEQANENGNGITSSISYIDERGGEHTYILNADGSGTRTVSETPPGEFDILTLSAGQHTLEFRNGVKYVFSGTTSLHTMPDQMARLDYIEDPYGNRLDMTYDGNGRLITIEDNLNVAGRDGLTLTYHGTTHHIKDITDWSGRKWQYDYDADGNLVTITSPLIEAKSYTYHAGTHLLNEIILPEDRNGQQAKTSFTYYGNNKAFTNANAYGEGEIVDYDLYRQRTRVTDPRGFVREHVYDTENGALIKLKEPDGAILQFENNADGLRYIKTDALGYETRYSFMVNGSISASASNNNGLVSREIDPRNQSVFYEYDTDLYDQPTTVTDKRNNVTTRSYYSSTDAGSFAVAGKLAELRATVGGVPDVLLESYRYYADDTHPAFGQLKQKNEYIEPNPLGHRRITDYVYESNGINIQTLTVTGAVTGGSIVKEFTYDTLGRVETENLERINSVLDQTPIDITTNYEYDDLDRVTHVTNTRGDIAETVYDKNGKVKEEKVHYFTTTPRSGCDAPNGDYVVCTYATHGYDAADRRISTTDILGNTTTFAYDANGNLIKQTDANDHSITYEYDSMNRRTAVIDANGHRSEFKYDLAGRLIKTTDAIGNSVQNEYDELGRLTKVITEEGRETQFQYDENGNTTHTTDANAVVNPSLRNNQNTTVYRDYDELNRLILERDATDGDTHYTYDLLGNITSITDAEGQLTSFLYDDLGRLVETTDPLGKKDTVFLYDEAGNVLAFLDASGRGHYYFFDELNRQTRMEHYRDAVNDFPNSLDDIETFVYDDFGDLIQISNYAVTYDYSYTPRHELASKTDSRLGKTLNWTYDAVGNVQTKTDYQGDITEFQYDSTNRLVAMKNNAYLQVSYHYDGTGRLINRILSNGAQTDYTYDKDNRLTGLKNISADGTAVEDLTYLRDNVGNITKITDNVSSKVLDYDYDAMYRLTDVDSTDNSEDRVYTYDAVGNRKTETANGTTYYYCYHETDCSEPPVGNRLYSIHTTSPTGPLYRQFEYDDSGRVIEKQDGAGTAMYTISYTGRGRADQIVSDQTYLFAYDPNDYRIKKDNRLYHLEGEHLEATYSVGGQLQEKYLRGVIVDEIVNGYTYHSSNPNDWTNYTYHHDHLNSVTHLTGHAGTQEESNRYDAFGAQLNGASITGNSLLYTGRESDSETGLYYYRARYYDPEIGRFISEDPLGFEAGINFYAYVNNNPVNFNDPFGEDTQVSLGFTRVIGPTYHQLVILTDTETGAQFATRAGPEAQGFGSLPYSGSSSSGGSISASSGYAGSGGFGFGTITASARPFDENFGTDYQNQVASQHLGTIQLDYSDAINRAVEFSNVTNENAIPYWPLGPNSNSYASTFVEALTGSRPSSDLLSPGADMGSPSPQLTFDPVPFSMPSTSAAGGGFVLYPNRPNTNMMQTVYAK